ncbi:hypothetical protein J3E68DRAFT_403500 [Trichoderma sp. SZMC 28012]
MKLVNQLTKQKVAVLPPDKKMMLKIFAGMKKNDEIERWIEECPEDRSTVEWTEEEEIPVCTCSAPTVSRSSLPDRRSSRCRCYSVIVCKVR